MSWLISRFREWQRRRAEKRFLKCLESGTAENFLQLTLNLMRLAFKLDKDFRQNIIGFTGICQFRSIDNSITIAAVFNGKDMEVKKALVPEANVAVIFRDGRALLNYLLTSDRDILRMLLNNEVIIKGNVNYIMKFGYMANHLQLALSGRLP
jgi:hypothetical protein